MSSPRADRDGVRLPAGVSGTCSAVFDGKTIWRFEVGRDQDFVAWPNVLRPWLDGTARLEIRVGERTFDLGEIQFGDGTERIEFVDKFGIPIVVDKWGLVQRPFEGRGDEVTGFLADTVERIIDVLARECGVHLWMAFGTLLGAMREGRAIAHDSDMDFAYLSDQETPALMIREMFAMKRALTRAGMRVLQKTGSFLTVVVKAPDGAPATIDVYTCFHLSGKFLATATLRADVPRDAILPLGELLFEGRMMPAPADPDWVLAASYGPSWSTPDPGFKHEPGPDVTNRFDDWFGNLMRQRREWEIYWRDNPRGRHEERSDFLEWVGGQLDEGSAVIDLGTGRGDDAMSLGEAGHRVWALDYSREAWRGIVAHPQRNELSVSVHRVNFYDTRDVLSIGALIAVKAVRPRAVYARHIFDALPPDARENVWQLAAMILRGGGRMYAEFDEVPPPAGEEPDRFYGRGGRLFPVTIEGFEADWTRFGATEILRSRIEVPTDPGRVRWRIVLAWA